MFWTKKFFKPVHFYQNHQNQRSLRCIEGQELLHEREGSEIELFYPRWVNLPGRSPDFCNFENRVFKDVFDFFSHQLVGVKTFWKNKKFQTCEVV